MTDELLVSGGPYQPRVYRRTGQLEYDLPVESGAVSLSFSFPITAAHAEVLRRSPRRYAFLFAALHHPFQLPETQLTAEAVREMFDTVLLGDAASVSALLTRLDAESNGAVSNLMRLMGGHDYEALQRGDWFGAAGP